MKDNGRLVGKLTGLNVVKSLLKEKEEEITKLNIKLSRVNNGESNNPRKREESFEGKPTEANEQISVSSQSKTSFKK